MTRALLLIDIQNGFCPGGNLPVAEGDQVVPVANALMRNGRYELIVASKDWHPADHGSFASQHAGAKPFDMGELNGRRCSGPITACRAPRTPNSIPPSTRR